MAKIRQIRLTFLSSRYTVVKKVNLKLGSDKGEVCIWIIIGVKPAHYLKIFWTIWCPEISLSKVYAIKGPVLYPYKNEEIRMALFYIRFFLVFALHFALLCITSALGHKCMGHNFCMSHWHLDCSVGQQLWPTINAGSDTHFGMRIYKVIEIVSYTKMACRYIKDSQNIEVFWIIMVHQRLYTLY